MSCVANIVKRARAFNAGHGMTGVLVFDGERFCQYVEGPVQEMEKLVLRLESDSRHRSVEVLLSGLSEARRFPSWSMAYSTLDDMKYLSNLVELPGDGALRTLQASLDSMGIC